MFTRRYGNGKGGGSCVVVERSDGESLLLEDEAPKEKKRESFREEGYL